MSTARTGPDRGRPAMSFPIRKDFWGHVLDEDGRVGHRVARMVVGFTAYSLVLCLLDSDKITPSWFKVGTEITPYEIAGGVVSALLVLRVNAGYDRWWEGRKLWGGITNECRNLAIVALANGPADPAWRREVVTWTVAFAHACRRSLRGQSVGKEIAALVGADQADRVAEADHMPVAVASRLSGLLREARDRGQLDPFAYMQAENQRALLIDHIGGCERILKTPLALAYVVLIRRMVLLFFLTLPFALIPRVGWLTPLFTLLIAYPLLALDQIAEDLQHPFSTRSISHLPLDEITDTIERNLLALLGATDPESEPETTLSASESVDRNFPVRDQ